MTAPTVGSAVTARRWSDGAPFDADGPGTSDLDLTLVGDAVIGFDHTGWPFMSKAKRPAEPGEVGTLTDVRDLPANGREWVVRCHRRRGVFQTGAGDLPATLDEASRGVNLREGGALEEPRRRLGVDGLAALVRPEDFRHALRQLMMKANG